MPIKVVARHGSPHWYLRGTVRGITVDETTGTDDRKKAEEIRIRREAEVLDRSIHGARRTATFLEASIMYLEQGGEARYINKISRYFGTTLLENVDQIAIDTAARKLYPNASNSTLNRQVYTPISAVLKFAAIRKLCGAFSVKRPRQPKARYRWLTHREADRLIDVAAPHLKPLLIFLFYTGARLSEALYLDWREVDLRRGHVTFLDTKSGTDRGVPLHPRAVAALANLKDRSGAVFRTNCGEPYTRKDDGGGQIKTAFATACRKAGISKFTPHGCRHTWATWHYRANKDVIALMELGGWTSEKMVLRYTHVNKANLSGSVNKLPWGKSGDKEKRIPKRRAS